MWCGVDIRSEDVADNFEAFIWEPSIVKINAITAASEVRPGEYPTRTTSSVIKHMKL